MGWQPLALVSRVAHRGINTGTLAPQCSSLYVCPDFMGLSDSSRCRAVAAFQSSWTQEFGFVFLKDRAVCTLCCENVVCRTSSVKRYFEMKHEKSFKDQADKAESIKRAVSRYDKQASSIKVFTTAIAAVFFKIFFFLNCYY